MNKTVILLTDNESLQASLTSEFIRLPYDLKIMPLTGFFEKALPRFAPVSVIIDLVKLAAIPRQILEKFRSAYPESEVPALGLLEAKPSLRETGFDSILIAPCHPAQIVQRTLGLIRLSEMEREIELRLETLNHEFGVEPTMPSTPKNEKFTVLFIGKASPEFMVVINALQKKNVQVVAAFTSFTAFDYLYDQSFDAVVMNGVNGLEPALTIGQTMRKNAKLYHLPALLLVNSDDFDAVNRVYSAGINDIIDTNSAPETICARVLEQANFHRIHTNFIRDFNALGGDICVDAQTKLYNKRYFNAHLSRVYKHYSKRGEAVTLCLIRVHPKDKSIAPERLAPAYAQIGGMLKNLVRVQDITARIETNVFAIAFPGQTASGLGAVTNRIESILSCASFSDRKTGKALDISLEITLNTLGETGDTGEETSVA